MSSENKTEEAEAAPQKTSLVVHIVVFLLVTTIAGGAGFAASLFIKPPAVMHAKSGEKSMGNDHAKVDDDGKEGEHGQTDGSGKEAMAEGEEEVGQLGYAKSLAPIVTNLASPKEVWVRMEVALLAKDPVPEEMREQIHQDIFAYMRTVKLHHVDGPSGYINLKAELAERAEIRSGGKVKNVLIRTLLFE